MSPSSTNGTISPVTEFWWPFLSERWPSRGAWGAGQEARSKESESRGQRTEVGGQRSEGAALRAPRFLLQAPGSQLTSLLLALCSLLFAWLVLVEIGVEAWYRMHERTTIATPAWSARWPKD